MKYVSPRYIKILRLVDDGKADETRTSHLLHFASRYGQSRGSCPHRKLTHSPSTRIAHGQDFHRHRSHSFACILIADTIDLRVPLSGSRHSRLMWLNGDILLKLQFGVKQPMRLELHSI